MTGPLNVGATAELAQRVEGLLVAGARYLVVDLSQAHGVRPGVLRLLTTTSQRLMASRGWLKLSGAGPTLLAELDEASLSDLFTLYQAATGQGGHDDTRSAYPAPHQVA
nr:STAS domain-containing protein [Pseudonocardia asaccharolytica]